MGIYQAIDLKSQVNMTLMDEEKLALQKCNNEEQNTRLVFF